MKILMRCVALLIALSGFSATAHAQFGFYQPDINNPPYFDDTLSERTQVTLGENTDEQSSARSRNYYFDWHGPTAPATAVANYAYYFSGGYLLASAAANANDDSLVNIISSLSIESEGVPTDYYSIGGPYVALALPGQAVTVHAYDKGDLPDKNIGGGLRVSVTLKQTFSSHWKVGGAGGNIYRDAMSLGSDVNITE